MVQGRLPLNVMRIHTLCDNVLTNGDGCEAMKVKLPASVIKGLKIGLQLERKGLGGRGLVDETIQMARTGVRTGKWDEWKIVKASNWFARHVADRRRMKNPQLWDKAPRYSPAYVAWALWGDDGKGAGKKWIDKKAKELRARGVKPSPRKNPAVSPKTPYLFDLDPHELVFTESRRSKKLSRVRDVDTSLPIVVTKIRGKYHILDGHHRTIRAEQENRLVRAVVIPPSSYRSFKKAGIHQADMFRAFARELIEQRKASPRKNTPTSVTDFAREIRQYYGIEFWLRPSTDNIVKLDSIVVPKAARKRGTGTDAMFDLIRFADKNDLILALTPSKDFGATSVARLKRFYSQFGFVSNKGRNKDYRTRETMIRYPKARANPPRTQPYKYGVPAKYLKGLPDKVARARAKEIIMRREAGVKTSKPLPGDKIAQSKGMKGSKWTRMYKQKYGAIAGKNRAAIARETGISPSIINEVYKRGVGASRTSGHRPGATDSSWALARTHAFVMKVLHGKGSINQDPDLARKVKAARRNPGRRKRKMSVQFYDIKKRKKVSISDNEISKRPIRTKNGTRYQLVGNTNDGRQVFRFVSKDDYQSADYPVIR